MRTTVQLGLALLVGLAACRPGDVAGADEGRIMLAPGDPVWGLTGAQRNLFGRGRGLLDAVPDAEILAREDPDERDGDGISGRPNRTADGRVGRFGRKANFATLREFNAGAFLAEQGITNPEQPAEGTIGGAAIPPGVDPVADPEIDQATLDQADAFVRFLAAPSPLRGGCNQGPRSAPLSPSGSAAR